MEQKFKINGEFVCKSYPCSIEVSINPISVTDEEGNYFPKFDIFKNIEEKKAKFDIKELEALHCCRSASITFRHEHYQCAYTEQEAREEIAERMKETFHAALPYMGDTEKTIELIAYSVAVEIGGELGLDALCEFVEEVEQ